jgi:hypothetical protein
MDDRPIQPHRRIGAEIAQVRGGRVWRLGSEGRQCAATASPTVAGVSAGPPRAPAETKGSVRGPGIGSPAALAFVDEQHWAWASKISSLACTRPTRPLARSRSRRPARTSRNRRYERQCGTFDGFRRSAGTLAKRERGRSWVRLMVPKLSPAPDVSGRRQVTPTTSGASRRSCPATVRRQHGGKASVWRLRPRQRHLHLHYTGSLTTGQRNPGLATARGPALVVAKPVTRLVARACKPFRCSRSGRFGRS